MKLTPPQKRVVERLRGGGAVLHIIFEDGGKLFTIDDHDPVNPRTIESLLARGILVEAEDAMFGVSNSLKLAETFTR